MKKHWNKALFAVLTLALALSAGSCSLFAGSTYLAIDWYGDTLVRGTWDLPYPFSGFGWMWDEYYEVEPGSYYGEYALDYDGNGTIDSSAYYFYLTIEAEVFTDTNYYLYLDSTGPYLWNENKVPAPRIFESDGTWSSTISLESSKITLRSNTLADPMSENRRNNKK